MIRIAVAAVAILLATCAAAGTLRTNVRGVVVGGPVVVCPPGEPCDPQPKPVFVAFYRGDRAPVRARIRPSGAFALYLRPGRYVIRVLPPQNGQVRPSVVRVLATRIIRLRLIVR